MRYENYILIINVEIYADANAKMNVMSTNFLYTTFNQHATS